MRPSTISSGESDERAAFLDLAHMYAGVNETPSGDLVWTFAQRDIENLATEVVTKQRAALQSKACASVGVEPAEPAFAPWLEANEHLLNNRGYTPRDFAMFAWHAAGTVSLAPSRVGWVYLAGPMTGYEDYNFPLFNSTAARLRAEGFNVINPAEHGIVEGAEWADYLRFDLAKIAGCESIALLPGWEASKGARLEVHVAQALGMSVRCLDGATPPAAPAATEAPSKPFAYYIHIAAEQRGEFVHDLDEALDDLTNCECKITELFDRAPPVAECPYCHACWPECLHCDGTGRAVQAPSLREVCAALLSLIRRDAPHLSGKVLGEAEAALAAVGASVQPVLASLSDEHKDGEK